MEQGNQFSWKKMSHQNLINMFLSYLRHHQHMKNFIFGEGNIVQGIRFILYKEDIV
jgi:hypothetical protein